ncbi:MAG: DUF2723 domain-containing protein [bacterium]|nr:DUF2723 domain-containing protein [bacterium]
MNNKEKNTRHAEKKASWWYALLIIPFAVYLKGLAPSVVFGDTGDFQTAGWIWGAAHEPGYPLLTVLVGIFERLPIPPLFIQTDEFSAVAWRANLVSMIFAVLALMVLFMIVNRITARPVAAMLSCGALAFSRVFWWHSEVCENDTLSALFILLLIYLSVRIVQEAKPAFSFWLALVMGLAVSHHQSILLFFPAVFIYLGINGKLKFSGKQWIGLVLAFILGLTPFLYLPLVKYRTPGGPLNFITQAEYDRIAIENPDELAGRYSTEPALNYFIDFIGRGVYAREREYTSTDEALSGDITTTSDVFQFYLDLVYHDFGIILSIAGLIGLFLGYRGWRDGRGSKDGSGIKNSWILIFGSWILYFLVINFYRSGDILHAPYYNLETAGPGLMLPLEVIFSIFIGMGLSAFLDWMGKFSSARWKIEQATMVIGLVLIGINLVLNYEVGDKSKNTLAHEYVLNALDSCAENSVLIVAGDEIYAYYFLHYVFPDQGTGLTGYRPDVKVSSWTQELERFSDLANTSMAMGNAMGRVAEENPGKEINATFFNTSFLSEPSLTSYFLARRGLIFTFVPPGRIEGYLPCVAELSRQTGLELYKPDLPETYRWEFWDCDTIDPAFEPQPQFKWLWAPEADIQWRISEMLLFYGSDALSRGDNGKASGYFYRMAMVEPENPDAWQYLEYSLGNRDISD